MKHRTPKEADAVIARTVAAALLTIITHLLVHGEVSFSASRRTRRFVLWLADELERGGKRRRS